MNAVGLIVEYNPFHNGHLHHLNQAKETANADVVAAVMSGSFLQRGEPAIIDKFHRAKAALAGGIDIILELPYAYAVQSSRLFAKGSVLSLYELGVESICFGSESGKIDDFLQGYYFLKENEETYTSTLKSSLKQGVSYPAASKIAYDKIGLANNNFDLTQPNNVLGMSYVNEVLGRNLPIKPMTIPRIKSQHHDMKITGNIASATSIRKELLHNINKTKIRDTIPDGTMEQLVEYRRRTGLWHDWEQYFLLLNYRVQTMSHEELALIAGVDEGLEFRIKETASTVSSFHEWVQAVKSKRYTWTRLQRMFTHILTNTTKKRTGIGDRFRKRAVYPLARF
ncbi:nucleotidyltransferase [Virgibacillus halophilus]|uniref:tRNA(Met) cytidine acetate ligase n=1 Tax=Tigheibacillus halophilus TaxID=361280 RepID=A0ABU5CAP8_9BACI|nr:nucleotidyltransferase [Virgibacillus halophilus]